MGKSSNISSTFFNMVFQILLAVASLVMVQAGLLEKPRIINGETAFIRNIPHQVALLNVTRPAHNQQFCGGSLIGAQWVLTAAHCVDKYEAEELNVRVGATYFSQGGVVVAISRIVIHHGYNDVTMDNDFALLKMSFGVFSGKSKLSVDLPTSDEVFAEGTKCTISGWGKMENGSKSAILKMATIPIADRADCVAKYSRFTKRVTDNMICAGFLDGSKDTCQGDSGGPLTCNGKLAGVTSFGRGCAVKDYPGIYAAVAAARVWIEEETGI